MKDRVRLIKIFDGEVAWTSRKVDRATAERWAEDERDRLARNWQSYVVAGLPVPPQYDLWEFKIEAAT